MGPMVGDVNIFLQPPDDEDSEDENEQTELGSSPQQQQSHNQQGNGCDSGSAQGYGDMNEEGCSKEAGQHSHTASGQQGEGTDQGSQAVCLPQGTVAEVEVMIAGA